MERCAGFRYPNRQATLDRMAAQEGGDRWNGPYRLAELDERIPAGLKSAEYRAWISKAYKPEALDYYVISQIVGYSERTSRGSASTIGRFPVCVCILDTSGGSYRRFVFNTTGTDTRWLK